MGFQYDTLVIGSGIAGLSFALKVANAGYQVAIITKKKSHDAISNYAQGGIACVTHEDDNFELHIQDTLKAGDGLCNEAIVRMVIEKGPERINDLTHLGITFSQLDDGRPSLGKEGGHSKRRILHVKDHTGRSMESGLLRSVGNHPNITLFEHFLAVDIITLSKYLKTRETLSPQQDATLGIYAYDVETKQVKTFQAPVVMLATGGIGQVYQYTTNPDIATGDGIAMAYRAGAKIVNMEFVQFHPTAFYSTNSERFLISEAARGEGAILRNSSLEPFMVHYDNRADLAPRDIVARAIDSEMKASGAKHVWLDFRNKDANYLKKRFPNIYQYCEKQGITIDKDLIPVVPAAHYLCGGIQTNAKAQTDIPGLYACGEAACTGLHGANRLASNSLLEAVVMAHEGAQAAIDYLKKYSSFECTIDPWQDGDMQNSDERVVLSHNNDELKRTLWDYVGIVRSDKRLERASHRISLLSREINEYYWNFKVEPTLLELRNQVQIAELIIQCAQQRHESRGLHYNLDYPKKREVAKNSNSSTLANTNPLDSLNFTASL